MPLPQACELLNLYTHLHLASLRTPPGHPRKFPTGFGFGVAVCANYWFETLGVLAWVMMTGGDFGSKCPLPFSSLASLLFPLLALV